MSDEKILVLGIGNLLWADEGFGVRCVEALNEKHTFPENVTLMDGGTQGLYLLPYITGCDRLLILDAIDFGLPPGSVHEVEGDDVPKFTGAKKMSLHQSGFQEVLAAAVMLNQAPKSMVLIGVQPVDMMDYGGSLQDETRNRIPDVLEKALAHLNAWGAGPVTAVAGGETIMADPSLAMDVYEAGRPPPELACRTGDGRILKEWS